MPAQLPTTARATPTFSASANLWARADFSNGLAISAGQMWSLATENNKGIANRQEWFPLQIDPQYVVGYNWQRAYAARIAKNFGDKVTLAASIEGADRNGWRAWLQRLHQHDCYWRRHHFPE